MLDDGVKASGDEMRVVDVSTLLVESLDSRSHRRRVRSGPSLAERAAQPRQALQRRRRQRSVRATSLNV